MTNEGNNLALYAINTGQFYPTHLELARGNKSRFAWIQQMLKARNRYQREIEDVEFSPAAIEEAADYLRDYYRQHVAEF